MSKGQQIFEEVINLAVKHPTGRYLKDDATGMCHNVKGMVIDESNVVVGNGCIIGQAVERVTPGFWAEHDDIANGGIDLLEDTVLADLERWQVELLTLIQVAQDAGSRWGHALNRAMASVDDQIHEGLL